MERIASWGNTALAFHRAAAGKRSVPEVESFAARLDAALAELVRDLAAGSWRPGAYRRFTVRDPKLRVIHAAPFRDRVVHHALMNILGSMFERGAIAHSYACRPARGNLAAVRQAVRCTRACRFFLKLDIRRYFDSVRHAQLRTLFRRRFKDGAVLDLLDRIVASFEVQTGRGLPIGTLTSQYFANFYLDGLDHWVQQRLGVSRYVRYMDDLVLWHDDPPVLLRWREEVRVWLAEERGLVLKTEPDPTPCDQGVPFLGYRIVPGKVLLGRRARRRLVSRLTGYEKAFEVGRLSAAGLQRRTDALLAFTDVAACRAWRRRAIARLSSAHAGWDGAEVAP